MKSLIFDLSEVFISGLVGVERELSRILNRNPNNILPSLTGSYLDDLCCGLITENEYLEHVISENEWRIEISQLKGAIRNNFHLKTDGMEDLIVKLSQNYEAVLLSDNAIEWVEYILDVHDFLSHFHQLIFSYEIGKRKNNPDAFRQALSLISRKPEQCLFIDDNEINIQVAESVGIKSIKFTTREMLIFELNQLNIR